MTRWIVRRGQAGSGRVPKARPPHQPLPGAERRLLPFARDNGIAVMINQPFGGGGLLRKLSRRKLPDWAGEIGCTSWAQVLLKFVLAHPAVTCVIPGTSKPEHMRDNAQAGLGVYPDAAMINRMIEAVAA